MVHAGQHMFAKIRVAEDPANGALLGLCATHNRPFPSDPVEPDAAYVMVIGVNGPVRGWRTPDGNRLGDVLLEDAIRQIHEDWGHGPSPRIWALVDPPNTASHRLFDRHDFKKLDAVPGGYDIRFLPREDP